MHMQWPSRPREAEHKATRTILVVRVAFHDFGVLQGFANLPNADVPNDGSIRRVFGELELIAFDLRLDFIDDGHVVSCLKGRMLEFSAWHVGTRRRLHDGV